ESDLPQLPPAKFVRRMDCLAEALVVYDPIGRAFPVSWAQVMLVAAGKVRQFEMKEVEISPHRPGHEGDGMDSLFGEDNDPLREIRVREEQTIHSILEILLI